MSKNIHVFLYNESIAILSCAVLYNKLSFTVVLAYISHIFNLFKVSFYEMQVDIDCHYLVEPLAASLGQFITLFSNSHGVIFTYSLVLVLQMGV